MSEQQQLPEETADDAKDWKVGSQATWELHKAMGIIGLAADSVSRLRLDEPMLDGVYPALEAARQILHEVLERAERA